MKIGILGAGNVGVNLGKGWVKHGHEVMFSSREPYSDKMKALTAEVGSNTSAGTIAETVAFGEVVVIALPANAVEESLSPVKEWAGKIVIDATNRFFPPKEGSAPSIAEDIARMLTGAQVVKAFNTIGAEQFLNPRFGDQQASMFICGDNHQAKTTVAHLAAELGFDVVDCGSLGQAVLLEGLAKLWVSLARGGGGRDIAFKLLRR